MRSPTRALALTLILLVTATGCAAVSASAGTEPIGVADGFHDDEPIDLYSDVPAVTGLDPALLEAVRAAEEAATAEGVDFWLTSGWRSERLQQKLLDDAIRLYRDEDHARTLVATPENSRHVTGDAVDIGPTDGYSWMNIHSTEFGLCQVYANEMWHYELLTEPGGECPPMKQDARG